jgi:hypothetical protein
VSLTGGVLTDVVSQPVSSLVSPMGVDIGHLGSAVLRKQVWNLGHRAGAFTRPSSAGPRTTRAEPEPEPESAHRPMGWAIVFR